MKKIALFLAAVLLMTCVAGCTQTAAPNPTSPTASVPGPTNPTSTNPAPTDPTSTEPAPTTATPTGPAPTDPAPTGTAPTDPAPTVPVNTDPAPTNAAPTNPAPTNPTPTSPAPSNPSYTVADPSFLPGPSLVDKYGATITSDEADLRKMAVEYMYAMANIKWTAGIRLDYSFNSKSLVYEPGKTYLGMVYNNNANGFEAFLAILDGSNKHTGTDGGWDTSPGNSCATSIRHAWQQISPTVNYGYSADMMPYYANTGILPVGNIDWSVYNGSNTNSIIEKHDSQVIFQAYAMMLPGDALVRYLDNGGHALMLTKNPTVVYNSDNTIDMNNSYLYLTDQNNRLHTRRQYPSSWEVDRAVSFASALADGFLPVTCAELLSGQTATPTFELTMKPTVTAVQNGTIKGTVKSNYFINTVRMEIYSGDTVVASGETHPYKQTCGFSTLGKELKISSLPAGKYKLVITADVAFGSQTLVVMEFVRGDSAASGSQGAVNTARAEQPVRISDEQMLCAF